MHDVFSLFPLFFLFPLVQPGVTGVILSHEEDDNGHVIVPEGTTVMITITVRSDVLPEILWKFTNLHGETSVQLNTTNMKLYQTTNVTVLKEEQYQVYM